MHLKYLYSLLFIYFLYQGVTLFGSRGNRDAFLMFFKPQYNITTL